MGRGLGPGRHQMMTTRLATETDVTAIEGLIERAIPVLLGPFLSADELAVAREFMGVDPQLIADRTYFLTEIDGQLAGCGGWSRRATLFGSADSAGRDPRLLDPATEAARVRAIYTDPGFSRRGVASHLLALVEDAAAAEGFRRLALGATAGGLPAFRAAGFSVHHRIDPVATNGTVFPITHMEKAITRASA